MKTLRIELVILSGAILSAIAAAGWLAIVNARPPRRTVERRQSAGDSEVYRGSEYRIEVGNVMPWNPPIPQRGSTEWIYDLFTPPEIYYDGLAKRFSVSPPKTSLEPAAETLRVVTTPLSGIQLRDVVPELFRLQLVGFFRSGSSDLGLFQNVQSGETFVAGRGRVVSALGLIVENVQVGTEPSSRSDDSATQQTIAKATIKDQVTGSYVTLSTRDRYYGTQARARLELSGTKGELREVTSGDTIELNGERFAVVEVRLAPPSVTLSRVAPTSNECFTLQCSESPPSSSETPSA